MAEEEEPASTANYKIDITVGGHTVICEGPDRRWTERTAWTLFRATAAAARRIPFGFSVGSAEIEREADGAYDGQLLPWEEVEE